MHQGFKAFRLFRVAAAALALTAGAAGAAVNLPQLRIDTTQTTVSGLSSGGYMAVQLHVAYSATFRKGVGVVAGGPYNCAENSITNATGRCLSGTGIPTSNLVTTTNNYASAGSIDPVANMAQSQVYLFSGTLDSTVRPAVMNALRTYYRSFVPDANVVYRNDLAAEHAMITDDYGSACSVNGSPFINDCNFDLAGTMLAHFYGTLNPRNNATLPASNFVEFNQSQFITGHGMAPTGWAYIPQACAAGGSATCRLHVVFHGCRQNVTNVSQQYVRNTGYNRWADSNNIVVLYPQTSTAAVNSCWDWWGYDNANYARKSGPQMVAIKAMVDQVSAGGGTPPPPPPGTTTLAAPTAVTTSNIGTSSVQINWAAVSGAAGYNVYRAGNKVNALAVSGTSYTNTGLTPATAYSWTVRAVNSSGAEGATSAAASATTLAYTPPPPATCFTSSNYAHTVAGRATALFGYTYANGSNQNMGLWNIYITTTLRQTGTNYYVIGTCP